MHDYVKFDEKNSAEGHLKYAFVIVIIVIIILRAAFKFGRRVHFALRRKMLKPPIARLPAI